MPTNPQESNHAKGMTSKVAINEAKIVLGRGGIFRDFMKEEKKNVDLVKNW